MAKINTLSEMKLYVLRRLGYPVNNIEMTDEQLDALIEDSAEIFNRYNYGEGSYNDYLVFSATNGIDEYSLSGNNVQDIYDFEFSTGTNGINSLFSPINMVLYSDWVVKGMYPGRGNSGSLTMASYQIDMQYLEDVKRAFQREYMVNWIPSREVLKIMPTPNVDMVGVLMVYKKSETAELFNNILFKDLCLCKAKMQWGMNLKKFQGFNLPGGGQFNGQEIYTEGKDEYENIMERIETEGEPIDFFIG